jgi:hypothetical protein
MLLTQRNSAPQPLLRGLLGSGFGVKMCSAANTTINNENLTMKSMVWQETIKRKPSNNLFWHVQKNILLL